MSKVPESTDSPFFQLAYDVALARASESEADLRQRAGECPAAPALELSPRGFDVLVETDVEDSREWQALGAAAVVSGQVSQQAKGPVPLLRGGALLDPLQVVAARADGAAGVVIDLALVDRRRREALLAEAQRRQLAVLLLVGSEEDLADAAEVVATWPSGAPILVGLRSDHEELAHRLPAGVARIAAGLALETTTPEHVHALSRLGYDAILLPAGEGDLPRLRLLLQAGRRSLS